MGPDWTGPHALGANMTAEYEELTPDLLALASHLQVLPVRLPDAATSSRMRQHFERVLSGEIGSPWWQGRLYLIAIVAGLGLGLGAAGAADRPPSDIVRDPGGVVRDLVHNAPLVGSDDDDDDDDREDEDDEDDSRGRGSGASDDDDDDDDNSGPGSAGAGVGDDSDANYGGDVEDGKSSGPGSGPILQPEDDDDDQSRRGSGGGGDAEDEDD